MNVLTPLLCAALGCLPWLTGADGAGPAVATWIKQGQVEYARDGRTLTVRMAIPGDQTVALAWKSYLVQRDRVTVTARLWAPQHGPVRNPANEPIIWTMPDPAAATLHIKGQLLNATEVNQMVEPVQVLLRQTLHVGTTKDAKDTEQIVANLCHYVPETDSWWVFPKEIEHGQDLLPIPMRLANSQIASIRTATGETWLPDVRCPLANVAKSLLNLPIARTAVLLQIPGMKQEQRMGCVLNGVKACLLAHGRSLSTTDMLQRLGLTEERLNSGFGIPWQDFHMSQGAVYQKLQIDHVLCIRAPGITDPRWYVTAPDTCTGDASIPAVCPQGQEQKRTRIRNWLAHGLLRLLLNKGLPIMADLYVTSDVSHVVTVLGYDADKRSYLINRGAIDETELVDYENFDQAWSGTGYFMAVINPQANLRPLPPREYIDGKPVAAIGILRSPPIATDDYWFLQEREFEGGIYIARSPEIDKLVGLEVELNGTVAKTRIDAAGAPQDVFCLSYPKVIRPILKSPRR